MPVLDNAKWELFAQGVAKGLPAYRAYLDAGYDCDDKTAMESASRLSRNDKIAGRVEELQKKAAATVGITIERTLQEIARLAFSDAKALFNGNGELIPIHLLDNDVSATISGLDVSITKDGDVTKKVKQWDKLAALEKCCRYLGIAKEQVEQHTKVEIVTPTDWLDDDD